jgi:redox-sensitive bicupin YhaK (pirin superfamily)
MNTIRRSADRGHADHGWLDSHHSFSFGEYHDPEHVEFGPLRVINEDRVVAGAGFGAHGHRDMEIISYVLAGALAHKDSLGNGSTLKPGDVQRMSAGSGIRHSEYNGSNTEPVHFLQIWIQPDRHGLAPSYEETHFEEHEKRGRLRLIGSADGADRSVRVHQDVRLYAGLFDADESASLPLAEGRRAYVHIVRGEIEVNGHALSAGDALKTTGESTLAVARGHDAEVLVFDLPGA